LFEVKVYPGVGYECNSFLIVDEKTVLIDTGTGSTTTLKEKIQKTVKKIDLIINTHAHMDHVGGNSQFSTDIAVHENDVLELEKGGLYGTGELFGMKASSKVDIVLREGDRIDTGELSLRVIHTPGHTPGGVCLLSNKGHLFSGDTLFSGGSFGRTDLPGGSTNELYHSLERLKSTEFEFLMPGHTDCVENGREHLNSALEWFEEIYERI
jgi:glyoxylase-like metal-dependent hydrolase (beta-lactamase superfamily II)